MLGVIKAQFIGDLRDVCSCSKFISRPLNDVLTDIIARAISGHLFDEIPEIIGSPAKFRV